MRRRSAGVFVSLAAICSVLAPSSPAGAGDDDKAWLALGDSYSSGEGIPGTPPKSSEENGIKIQGRDCRRATGNNTGAVAWSVEAFRQVGDEMGIDEIALVACTGAVVAELDNQIRESQERFDRDSWDIVTFSFGGNDIGFEAVLKGCLDLNSFWGAYDLTPGCDIDENELRERIDGLRDSLNGVFDRVADVVEPGGDIVVVGYPQIVEEVGRWEEWQRKYIGNCEGIRDHDVGMLRSAAGYLNQQLGAAAQDADQRHQPDGIRFHFLDIANDPYEYSDKPTDRHGLCTQDPWLNGQTIGATSGDVWEVARSFHPHQTGHTNTGRVLATFLRDNVRFDDGQCTAAAIADDLGQARGSVAILEGCLDDWAYVDLQADCETPCADTEALVNHESGSWTRITGFPSAMCLDEAVALGVPAEFRDRNRFRPCEVVSEIDFANSTLPADSCRDGDWASSPPIKLVDGAGSSGDEYADDDWGSGYAEVYDLQIVGSADFDDDGQLDWLVKIGCSAGGTFGTNIVLPLGVEGGDLRLLGSANITAVSTTTALLDLTYPDGTPFDAEIGDVSLDGESIVIAESYDETGDQCNACHTGNATVRWTWNGRKWTAGLER